MADTGSGIADFPFLVITVIVGATVMVLVYISNLLRATTEEDDLKSASFETPRKEKKQDSSSQAAKASKKKHTEKWSSKDSKQSFTHPWLLTSLKGHSGRVLDMDFSSNGKFLGTCAEDRAVLLWSTKDWNQKEHKSWRINIEYDHARMIRWSPDSKAFIIHKATQNVLEVYKITKKPDGTISAATKALVFPEIHKEDMIGFDIACNGKFIMTCSEKTELMLSDLKGHRLAKVDTYLMSTNSARITPCGRFVVACGFTPDVKVWEVTFTKTGDFHQISRAFELSGHTAGVYDVGFSTDSSRMATVSKDGTWKVYDTKIEFEKGEDPHLLITGKYDHQSSPSHLAMSPNGEVVVVANGSTLAFYNVQTGDCDNAINNVYSGPITRVRFDSLGKYVLTAGDKHIRVFHNMTGYRTIIASTRAKLRPTLSSALRDRMLQQISEAEAFLKSMGEKTC